MIGIYMITCKINNKRYIGQSNDIKRRWLEHKTINAEVNKELKQDFIKYGIENFKIDVLEELEKYDRLEMLKLEKQYIDKLKPEYNISGIRYIVTQETKEKISQKCKIAWNNLPEEKKQQIIKLNLTYSGKNKGKHLSEETKQKLREYAYNHPITSEQREKMLLGIKNSKYVRTNQNHKKPIMCIETGEIFNSLKEAETKYNLTTLCGHLKGKYRTCKGNHYKYLEKEKK